MTSHRPPGPPGSEGNSQGGDRRAPGLPYHELSRSHGPDDLVSIYRAVPDEYDDIRPGDWVSTHGDWTQERADSEPGMHVLHARVPARHVYVDSRERDDDEAGYHGPHLRNLSPVQFRHGE